MNLVLKLDLNMVKFYHHSKMKFLGQGIQKLQYVQTDTHTVRQFENFTLPEYIGGKNVQLS